MSCRYVTCGCRPAEFDAVHRQRFAGGGGEGARGGEGEVHGRELSSCVHAQEHAGAAGESLNAPSAQKVRFLNKRCQFRFIESVMSISGSTVTH